MTTTFLNPRDVHAPVGPYSHTAVVQGGSELVFVSGQGPLDPQTGKIVGETIEEQTARVLEANRRNKR